MAVLEKGIWYPNKEVNELSSEDSFDLPEVAEQKRYHLYMSFACPFAHRPYLVINYLGLNDAISVSSVAAKRYAEEWLFDNAHSDPLFDSKNLVELYQRANPHYTGRVTVPVLWDKQEHIIVGNDSAAIAMDLATKWLPLAKNKVQLVPNTLREEIEMLNEWLHLNVNRKVYHVGFAKGQSEYDLASDTLFDAMEQLDRKLSQARYLHGSSITLSDLFLLPTLVRFEAVYEVHFKANKKPLKAFENLYRYMLDLLSHESIRKTIDIDYMKLHYYFSHTHINPHRIVPAGPTITW
ncbi:glutathione S-transferase C-terminal domain-containing protein [Vibrio pelagius]|uniref:glutathione S-transferase C-terminal domain-containing protein n=1 Tax=Vibrio pelagius TaxID=28169 RepID=UPI0021C2FF65|nr:glutathione S-transferase C-terminal domain-containing protein [Vibrio pelagius]